MGRRASPAAERQIPLGDEASTDKVAMSRLVMWNRMSYVFAEILDGLSTSVADGVTRALGRPPRDFADYVGETAATGVWHAGPQS